jgi:hypothetical protein
MLSFHGNTFKVLVTNIEKKVEALKSLVEKVVRRTMRSLEMSFMRIPWRINFLFHQISHVHMRFQMRNVMKLLKTLLHYIMKKILRFKIPLKTMHSILFWKKHLLMLIYTCMKTFHDHHHFQREQGFGNLW